jgi:hypothetical protein
MSKLEIKRIDSPLARDRARATEAPAAKPPAKSAQPSRRRAPRPRPGTEPASPDAPGHDRAPLGGLPAPPPLHEPLELLSTRIPSSLRRNLSDLTAALRARGTGRQTQKALPEQEVLALLVWLAGSPEDPKVVARLSRALDTYRAGRYAAAARELGQH